MHVRGLALYAAMLAAVAALFVVYTPGDEDGLPDVGARPRVDLVEVEGLALDAAGGRPAFRAARATPIEPSGPIQLAGMIGGLGLEDVEVDLSAALVLEAASGELLETALVLRRVRVRGPDHDRLVAGTVEFADGRARFPELVVWFPGTDAERVERDATLGIDALVERLGGR